MNFREATDELFSRIDHETLAKALGVSVAAIRQARLREGARAYRVPPPHWLSAAIDLAEDRAARYAELAENLRNMTPVEPRTNYQEKRIYNQSVKVKSSNKVRRHSLTDGGKHAAVR